MSKVISPGASASVADHLILRLRAPLMSFGGVKVDDTSPTEQFPSTSLIAGLIANALGFSHHEFEQTQRLQQRIQMASRQDVPGQVMIDYQTVDLGSEKMRLPGWTTFGEVEERDGSVKEGTHQMWVQYIADGSVTVVFNLARKIEPDDPSLQDIAEAFLRPARTLFIGKKSCIPSEPMLLGAAKGTDVLDVMKKVPYHHLSPVIGRVFAQWPLHLGAELDHRIVEVHGSKDWKNQVHVGSTRVRQGYIPVVPSWEDMAWTKRADINRFFGGM